MIRYENYLPGKTGELKVLYIDGIVDDGGEQEIKAWEELDPNDFESFDVIIFRYTNGKEKTVHSKKKK